MSLTPTIEFAKTKYEEIKNMVKQCCWVEERNKCDYQSDCFVVKLQKTLVLILNLYQYLGRIQKL